MTLEAKAKATAKTKAMAKTKAKDIPRHGARFARAAQHGL
jgi:hypothetical protein